ncbi:hypothetical protein BDZ94DRAFT_1237548 [Collybia nuda]|uniref:Macrofage activating glycoprotein n=1 Tax=Collybia nuda TaxID=64659 RepID=A0A9P6CI95_9AGAR|nr:hypothetical protein BDZ94DRAFT_1237548 [Collybia nuda]
MMSLGFLTLLASASCIQNVLALTPLVDKHFSYPDQIPYQVDTDDLERGRQTGFNICNSTTQNQASLCQTSFLNSIDDFCLWAPIDPNSEVGNVEGEMVAWCTKPGHGSRLIPKNSLQGVQFMKTPDYVQVVGYVDQSRINLDPADFGGEMDPHGADLRGNPLGGIFYSNAFGTDKTKFTQVIEWHNFIGTGFFCLKACDPAGPNAAHFCEHIYDRIGCKYNAPNNAQNGTFESCQGDNQDFPGIYTVNGQVMTYTQPPEALGAIQTIPYEPRVPASSNCQPFTSSVLYTALATVTAPGDQPTTTGAAGGNSTASGGSAGSGSGSGTAKPTGTSTPNNNAGTVAASILLALCGVTFSALFLS